MVLYFQDQGSCGRVGHLEPVGWKNDWSVSGTDADGDGRSQPEPACRKSRVPGPTQPLATPVTSDEFSTNSLGL